MKVLVLDARDAASLGMQHESSRKPRHSSISGRGAGARLLYAGQKSPAAAVAGCASASVATTATRRGVRRLCAPHARVAEAWEEVEEEEERAGCEGGERVLLLLSLSSSSSLDAAPAMNKDTAALRVTRHVTAADGAAPMALL